MPKSSRLMENPGINTIKMLKNSHFFDIIIATRIYKNRKLRELI